MAWPRAALAFSLLLLLSIDASHTAQAAADPEEQAWEAVQTANRAAGYQAYLNEYPNGRYAGAAKVKLAILQAQSAAPKPAVDSAPARVVESAAVAPAMSGRWGVTDKDLVTKAGTDLLKIAGFPERRAEALTAADAGDPLAQFLIALSYERGVGTFVDMRQRAQWLKKAGDQGLARAQAGYALVQIIGDDAPRDLLGGWNVLLQVARSGNAVAQYNAAMLVLQGMRNKGGDRIVVDFIDRGTALAMLRQSAQSGMPYAQYALGHAYMTGSAAEVPQDNEQARQWLSLAAAQGEEEARSDLNSLPETRVASSSSSSGRGDTVMKLGVLGAVAAIAGKSGLPMDQQAQVLSQVGTDLLSNGKTHATADGLIQAQNNAVNAVNKSDHTQRTVSSHDDDAAATAVNANTADTVASASCNTTKGAIVKLASKSAFTAASAACRSVAPEGFIWGTDSGNGHGTPEGSCQSALRAAFDGRSAATACFCYQASNTSEASAVNDGDWTCWVGEH